MQAHQGESDSTQTPMNVEMNPFSRNEVTSSHRSEGQVDLAFSMLPLGSTDSSVQLRTNWEARCDPPRRPISNDAKGKHDRGSLDGFKAT
jgi:hypothetical protein